MGILIIISTIVQFVLILTNIVGLPGNILAGIIPLIWFFSGHLTLTQLLILILIIAMGEIFEFISSFLLGKKEGIGSNSLIVGIIGTIVLGVIMAPLFFGLGAIIGSFIGAFLGVFIYEFINNGNIIKALRRGLIVFKSRIFGTVVKFSLGLFMVALTPYFLL